MFEKLLDDIIAENISHELQRIRQDLAENLVFLITIGRLKLLLNETRTMLVATEFDDMIVDIFELISLVRFTIGPEILQERTSHDLTCVSLTVGVSWWWNSTKTDVSGYGEWIGERIHPHGGSIRCIVVRRWR